MNYLIDVEKAKAAGQVDGDGAGERVLDDHEAVYNMALEEFLAWFRQTPSHRRLDGAS
jgi:hypothetical protein